MKKRWNVDKAKFWMYNLGMELIEGELFTEGGELVHESVFGNDCERESSFRNCLERVCWWEKELIDQAVDEVVRK